MTVTLFQITAVNVRSISVPDDNDWLCSSDSDQLVDGPDSSSGQLGEEDHALDVVVLQQMDVRAHVGDGPDVDHDHVLHFRELLLVESTGERHAE